MCVVARDVEVRAVPRVGAVGARPLHMRERCTTSSSWCRRGTRRAACRSGTACCSGSCAGATDERSLSPPGNVSNAPVRCIAAVPSNFSTLSPKSPLPVGSGLPVATYTLPSLSTDDAARRPDRAQAAACGVTSNATLPVPALGERDEPAVIRTAVAGVAAVADVHAPLASARPARCWMYSGFCRPTGIGVRRHARMPGERVEPDELMVDVTGRQSSIVGDDEDRVRRGVDHRRRQDAERIDVAATRPARRRSSSACRRDASTAPLPSCASSAYTVSFSVAVKTRPLNTSGCAYTVASSAAFHALCTGSSAGLGGVVAGALRIPTRRSARLNPPARRSHRDTRAGWRREARVNDEACAAVWRVDETIGVQAEYAVPGQRFRPLSRANANHPRPPDCGRADCTSPTEGLPPCTTDPRFAPRSASPPPSWP